MALTESDLSELLAARNGFGAEQSLPIELSWRCLPRDVRCRWHGSAAVDATVVPAFARPDRRTPRSRKAAKPQVVRHSADPDADWYVRSNVDPDADSGPAPGSVWGYEATLIVAGPGPPRPGPRHPLPRRRHGGAPQTWPRGGRQTPPGRSPRSPPAATPPTSWPPTAPTPTPEPTTFSSPPAPSVTGPSSTTASTSSATKAPTRACCSSKAPSTAPPSPNPSSTPPPTTGAAGSTRPPTRPAFTNGGNRVVPKAAADAEGHVRLRCPTSNPHPVARCDLKPASVTDKTRGKIRIPVTAELATHPPAICAQQSVTVPPDAAAKLRQDLLYGSDEWHAVFATLRNCVEGFNSYVKDGAHEALDNPMRRRVRGVAAQTVLVALQLLAANLRKIEAFLAEQAAVDAGTVRRLPRRRRSQPLDTWRPTGPAQTPTPLPAADTIPDPPLTA